VARAKAVRVLRDLPIVKGFRPLWMRPNYRSAVTMALEEYEAIRLVDYERLTHEQASLSMGVSRPTLTRIYEQARIKLGTALVEGRSFLIEGGEVKLSGHHYYCEECQHKFVQKEKHPQPQNCPTCSSQRITNLSECFMQGCRRCSRCR